MDSLAQIHDERHVVLNHQNSAIVFRSDIENEIAQFLCLGRSKTRCGFVKKEEVWFRGKGTRKTDTAFLAVAQSGSETTGLIGEVKVAEDFDRPPTRRGAAEALRHIPGLNVLADSQAAEQPDGLKCAHYARARKTVAREGGAITVGDRNSAGIRPLEPRKNIDERGLARAVRADQAQNLAACKPNADFVDRREAAEPDAHLLRFKMHE
jgi:hypothetical protein